MKRAWLIPLALASLASAWLLTAPTAGSSAAPGEELMTKEVKGLKFKVPADWAVEERGGTIAPIPVEEYLSKKFSTVTARFDAVDKRLGALETKQAELEQKAGALDKRLGTLEPRLGTLERIQGDQVRALQAFEERARQPAPAPANAVLESATGDLVPREDTER